MPSYENSLDLVSKKTEQHESDFLWRTKITEQCAKHFIQSIESSEMKQISKLIQF